MKIVLSIAAALMLVGCGNSSDTAGSRVKTQYAQTSTTTVYSGGGDVTVNNTSVSGGGTYIQNEDGTITYTKGDKNNVGNTEDNSDNSVSGKKPVNLDDYPGEEATPEECSEAGFFYCPLSEKCLPQPIKEGSCTSEAAMEMRINIQ